MKIIKRNGAEVPFDITKIITAVTKASDSVGGQSRLTREQITQIAAAVTDQCQALNRAVNVEEVQDMVENQLMDIQAHDVARHYITYRYVQSLKRQTNTTDERILSLIECQNGLTSSFWHSIRLRMRSSVVLVWRFRLWT